MSHGTLDLILEGDATSRIANLGATHQVHQGLGVILHGLVLTRVLYLCDDESPTFIIGFYINNILS